MMSAQVVRCDIAEKQWTAQRPSSCPSEVDFGQGLTMQATGPAKVVCAGDTVLNPQAPTLAYGSSSQIGSITCTSTEADVECVNSSGGSFKLSRESYEVNWAAGSSNCTGVRASIIVPISSMTSRWRGWSK